MNGRRLLRKLRLAVITSAVVAGALAAALAVTSGGTAPGLAAASTTATNVKAVTQTAVAATPRCVSSPTTMRVWIGIGVGETAAGSTYYPLEFTNLTTHACYMYGFPGVSALKAAGQQVGNAAGRVNFTRHTVYLAPGATAHATLQVTNVANYPPSVCKQASADTIRVYPPDAYTAAIVPYGVRACSAKGAAAPVYLHVYPVTAGTGIPGQA